MQLADKSFFITGAGSGLGRATAEHLAAHGASIVVADINAKEGLAVAANLGHFGLFAATDVCKTEAVNNALETGYERFGGLDGLINCAGLLYAERILKKDGGSFDLGQFKQCLDVNLIGSFNTLRLIAPYLKNNVADSNGERGIIVNTASIAAFEGQIGQAAYAAAKAGIIGMTLPAARELSRYGIRVMTIAPGVFETPMLAELSDQQRLELTEQAPFPSRLGQPSEYAVLVRQIIENPMLNGSVIRLDGAMRMC